MIRSTNQHQMSRHSSSWGTSFHGGFRCECGNHAFAPISDSLIVLVSPEDQCQLAHAWHPTIDSRGYIAVTRSKTITAGTQTTVVLAREILNLPHGVLADHASRDTLDNRRTNLRPCTKSQNVANSKPHQGKAVAFKGVKKARDKFRAEIVVAGQRTHLGVFQTAELAAEAYRIAALTAHGEFARFE